MERKVFYALLLASMYSGLFLPMIKHREKPAFSVRNLTDDKLALTLQYEGQEPFVLTLVPLQVISLSYKHFIFVDVHIYGRYRSYLSLPSFGYQAKSLAVQVQELAEKGHVFLLVRPGAQEGMLSNLASTVLPYVLDLYFIELPRPRRTGIFIQLFPQVWHATKLGHEMHPRYVLSVPEHGTPHDCTSAFIVFTTFWDDELSGEDEQEGLKYKVLKFLEAAHASLLEGVNRELPITARFYELYDEYKNHWVAPNDATL